MDEAERSQFYQSVKNYYIKSCDYIVAKFPLNLEVLYHAQVADVKKRNELGFSSLRFFFSKFPILILTCEGENSDGATDLLEHESKEYVSASFSDDQMKMSPDQFWFSLMVKVNGDGTHKFRKLCHIMLGILSIPHSNAECERIFSQVRKNKTDFRGSLSDNMLSALLVKKSRANSQCYNEEFSASFLKKAKAATTAAVKK